MTSTGRFAKGGRVTPAPDGNVGGIATPLYGTEMVVGVDMARSLDRTATDTALSRHTVSNRDDVSGNVSVTVHYSEEDAIAAVRRANEAARIASARMANLADFMSETSNRASDFADAIVQNVLQRNRLLNIVDGQAVPYNPDDYEGTEPHSPAPPVLSGRVVDID